MAEISNEQALNVLRKGAHVLGFLQELGTAAEKAQALNSELAHKQELIKTSVNEIEDLKLVKVKIQDDIKKQTKKLREKDDEFEVDFKRTQTFYNEKREKLAKSFETNLEKITKDLEFHQAKYETEMKKMKGEKETLETTINSLKGTLSRLHKQLGNATPEALGL